MEEKQWKKNRDMDRKDATPRYKKTMTAVLRRLLLLALVASFFAGAQVLLGVQALLRNPNQHCVVPILMGGSLLSFAENGDEDRGTNSDSEKAEQTDREEEEGRKKLFELYAEIELTENKKKKLLYEIQNLKKDVKKYDEEIEKFEQDSLALLDEYAEVLRTRQKLGLGANVASLLAAKGLRDFLYRATAFSEMTRSVEALNNKILASMDAVASLKQKKEKSLDEVLSRNKELGETLTTMKSAAKDLEKFLERKGEERAAAEAELALMEAKWKELKHTFEKVVKDVTGIIERGGLPRESVELQIGFTGVSVVLREENFNKVLKEFLERNHPEIAPMEFKLGDGGVYVRFPSHSVELFGRFEVEEQSMRYIVERGTYNNMEMPQASLDDLFLNREMVFDFKTLVGKSKLKSCTIHEGYIRIGVDLKL